MSHLTPEELIDLVEGVSPPDPVEGEVLMKHLASCAECRRQFDDARQMMAAVSEPDIPEPSPLFWERLRVQIQEAVAAEKSVQAGTWWTRWTAPAGWRFGALAGAGAVAVLALALTLRPGAPFSLASRPAPAIDSGAGHEVPPPAMDEASLGLLGGLASGLSWDAASEAGLAAGDAAVDAMLMDLGPAERLELQRVLQEELSRASNKVQG